jgi:hypothetical protein
MDIKHGHRNITPLVILRDVRFPVRLDIYFRDIRGDDMEMMIRMK